jgi:hypothetical protein
MIDHYSLYNKPQKCNFGLLVTRTQQLSVITGVQKRSLHSLDVPQSTVLTDVKLVCTHLSSARF